MSNSKPDIGRMLAESMADDIANAMAAVAASARESGHADPVMRMCQQLERTPIPGDDLMLKSKHGGARPGAGRKPIDPGARRVSHTLTMAPDAWRQLDEIGEEQGVRARGRIVEGMLAHPYRQVTKVGVGESGQPISELVYAVVREARDDPHFAAQIRAALGATDE